MNMISRRFLSGSFFAGLMMIQSGVAVADAVVLDSNTISLLDALSETDNSGISIADQLKRIKASGNTITTATKWTSGGGDVITTNYAITSKNCSGGDRCLGGATLTISVSPKVGPTGVPLGGKSYSSWVTENR